MAKVSAEKNAMSIQLHRGNSIGKDLFCKYKKSFVKMKCARTGTKQVSTTSNWCIKVGVLMQDGI